jgi:polyisoprenoid-binding protein YceI
MKIRLLSLLFVLSFLFTAFTLVSLQEWKVSEGFSVRFANPEVTGVMTKFKADIVFNENDLAASKFDVFVGAGSVSTGNPSMDSQAMGPELLDAKNYPEIKFKSSGVSKTSEGFLAIGMLDLHGIKKEIAIPFTFDKIAFKGSFAFKCKDYGMNGLGTGEADVLRIELVVPVVQK